MTSFFSKIILPIDSPESKSIPKNFNFAALRPKPAPPVMNFRFEKKCEPINTIARVTNPRFNPFSLADTGDIIIPTKAAIIPDTVSYTHLTLPTR